MGNATLVPCQGLDDEAATEAHDNDEARRVKDPAESVIPHASGLSALNPADPALETSGPLERSTSGDARELIKEAIRISRVSDLSNIPEEQTQDGGPKDEPMRHSKRSNLTKDDQQALLGLEHSEAGENNQEDGTADAAAAESSMGAEALEEVGAFDASVDVNAMEREDEANLLLGIGMQDTPEGEYDTFKMAEDTTKKKKQGFLARWGFGGKNNQGATLSGGGDDASFKAQIGAQGEDGAEDALTSRAAIQKYLETLDEVQIKMVLSNITPQLDVTDPRTKIVATKALGNMGRWGEAFAPKIATFVCDKNAELREAAAATLADMGKTGQQQLSKLLAHSEAHVREISIQELGRTVAVAHASQIITLLGDPDAKVRGRVVTALGIMQSNGLPCIKEVANVLSDEDADVRDLARDVVEKASQSAKEDLSIKNSLVLLSHREAEARLLGLRGFQKLGDTFLQKYVDDIAKLCSDPGSQDVQTLAQDLVKKVCNSNNAIAVQLLKHSDTGTRRIATQIVCNMGAEGAAHVDVVAGMLKDSHPQTRQMAAAAIGRMGAEKFAGEVAKLVQSDEHPGARAAGVNTLSSLGGAGKTHAHVVLPLLSHQDDELRQSAANAMRGWASNNQQGSTEKGELTNNNSGAITKDKSKTRFFFGKSAAKSNVDAPSTPRGNSDDFGVRAQTETKEHFHKSGTDLKEANKKEAIEGPPQAEAKKGLLDADANSKPA